MRRSKGGRSDAADETGARSAEMKISEKAAIDAPLQKVEEVFDKRTKIKSEPVAARSHETFPSLRAYNSSASVAVSSLGMRSAVSSDSSGLESNAKVSPAPLVEIFCFVDRSKPCQLHLLCLRRMACLL